MIEGGVGMPHALHFQVSDIVYCWCRFFGDSKIEVKRSVSFKRLSKMRYRIILMTPLASFNIHSILDCTDAKAGPDGAEIHARTRTYVFRGCTWCIWISITDFFPEKISDRETLGITRTCSIPVHFFGRPNPRRGGGLVVFKSPPWRCGTEYGGRGSGFGHHGDRP